MKQLLAQDAMQPVEQLLFDAVEGVLQPFQLLSCRLRNSTGRAAASYASWSTQDLYMETLNSIPRSKLTYLLHQNCKGIDGMTTRV